jgi:hypothetical protein
VGADNLIATMAYITPTAQGSLTSALLPTNPFTVHGVPANKQEANDLHQLSAIARQRCRRSARPHHVVQDAGGQDH